MTGAILTREFVVPGRKITTFVMRGIYALVLAATFGIIYLFHLARVLSSSQAGESIGMVSEAGEWLFSSMVTINILACLLFTPAYVAGAISQEKDQRTIQDLLLTSMSTVEIVLSKLFGRLGQVLLVLAVGAPLVAIGSMLGGVSGSMQLILAVMTLLWLLTVGSFTLVISVMVSRTRDAILGSYTLGTLIMVGLAIARSSIPTPPTWLQATLDAFNPMLLLSAASNGVAGETLWEMTVWTVVVLSSFSAVCVLAAIALLRPLGIRQLEVKARVGRRRWWRRAPKFSEERPMLWKEQHFQSAGRISRMLHVLGFLAAAALGAILVAAIAIWATVGTPGLEMQPLFSPPVWLVIARLLAWPVYLSILLSASAAFAGERERTTWDAILTSPLDDREIVIGKIAGCLWDVRWWLTAIALSMVLVIFLEFLMPVDEMVIGFTYKTFWSKLARIAVVVVTGSLEGPPGVIGIAAELAYLIGLGLRTSLSCNSSGKALAFSLLIWIGSRIVFWIAFYIVVMIIFVASLALGGQGAFSMFSGPVMRIIVTQIIWVGPLLAGLFWGGIGLFLIRLTIRQFDPLASRMHSREVFRLEGLPNDAPGSIQGMTEPIPAN